MFDRALDELREELDLPEELDLRDELDLADELEGRGGEAEDEGGISGLAEVI